MFFINALRLLAYLNKIDDSGSGKLGTYFDFYLDNFPNLEFAFKKKNNLPQLLTYLRDVGFVEYTQIGEKIAKIKLTVKGQHYIQFAIKDSLKSIYNSILVPVIVALVTALITTLVTLELLK